MKRGFTLVELMAVIIILGVVGLIVVPIISGQLKEGKNKLYETQIKNIEASARMWSADHISYTPSVEGEVFNIYLSVLKASGLIDTEIKNPKTNELFPNDLKIEISYKNNGLNYKVIENSGTITNTGEVDKEEVIINLIGFKNIRTTLAQYKEQGVIAMTVGGEKINAIDTVIKKDGVVSSINGVGTYTIIYTATYSGTTVRTASKERTVVIEQL